MCCIRALVAICALAILFSGGGFCQEAQAQVRPDAGAMQQQIDRERQQALPPKSGLERPAEPPAMRPPGGVTVNVTTFRFAGNTLLRSEQLSPVVEGYLNRPLDFAELQKAAADVAAAFREAGWIARAYLPRQDITSGTVTIQIVEAVFGGMRLEGPKPSRESSYHVMDMIEAQQKVGEPLNADALDRALNRAVMTMWSANVAYNVSELAIHGGPDRADASGWSTPMASELYSKRLGTIERVCLVQTR